MSRSASAGSARPTGFLSRISTDFFGDLLMQTLAENGVDARYVKRAADPSMLAFVSHPSTGSGFSEPQYAFFANGAADRNITEHDLPASLDESVPASISASARSRPRPSLRRPPLNPC
jgi:fructokinase